MPDYSRVCGTDGPVTFQLADGHRFTVLPPDDGGELRAHVEGERDAGASELGPWHGEQSAGVIAPADPLVGAHH